MTSALCPICGKQSSPDFKPFCSKRCCDVDLARWFNGSYSTPAIEEDDSIENDLDDSDIPQH